MMRLNQSDILKQEYILWHGRILQSNQKTNFFYTGSGFSVQFEGTKLLATFDVDYEMENEKPYILVTVSNQKEIKEYVYGLEKGKHTVVLFEGLNNKYSIDIRKRSESKLSRSALIDMSNDGKFLEINKPTKKRHIEWIGDSLTCGYGNLGADANTPFDTKDEDGLNAFA